MPSHNIGPAPGFGQLGGDLLTETAYHLPRSIGLAGLAGAAGGLGAGYLTDQSGRGAAIGGGAGAGGAVGMAGGSALAQILARIGGPMMKLTPEQTHALMQNADLAGSVVGGIGGAIGGGILGNRAVSDEKRAYLMRKAASLSAFPDSYPALAGEYASQAAERQMHALPWAGVGGLAGGALGHLVGDPVAGAGGGAGLMLGQAAGDVVGTGVGGLAAMGLGKYTGLNQEQMEHLMGLWSRGGGHLGRVVGGVGGGIAGVRTARRLAGQSGGEEKASSARLAKTAHRAIRRIKSAYIKMPAHVRMKAHGFQGEEDDPKLVQEHHEDMMNAAGDKPMSAGERGAFGDDWGNQVEDAMDNAGKPTQVKKTTAKPAPSKSKIVPPNKPQSVVKPQSAVASAVPQAIQSAISTGLGKGKTGMPKPAIKPTTGKAPTPGKPLTGGPVSAKTPSPGAGPKGTWSVPLTGMAAGAPPPPLQTGFGQKPPAAGQGPGAAKTMAAPWAPYPPNYKTVAQNVTPGQSATAVSPTSAQLPSPPLPPTALHNPGPGQTQLMPGKPPIPNAALPNTTLLPPLANAPPISSTMSSSTPAAGPGAPPTGGGGAPAGAGAATGASAASGGTPLTSPTPDAGGNSWLSSLGSVGNQLRSESGQALMGAGLAGMGTLGAATLARNFARQSRDDQDQQLERSQGRDFLEKQRRIEEGRQGAMLEKLRNPSLYSR